MKKTQFLLIIISLLFLENVSAQKSLKIEEFEKEISKTTNAAKKCILYSKISFEYAEIDLNISQKYLDSCKTFANKLLVDSLEIRYLHAQGNYLFRMSKFDSSINIYQKMARLSSKTNRWNDYGFAFMGVAVGYQNQNKLLIALKYYEDAAESFEKVNNKLAMTRAIKRKASLLIQSKSFDSGMKLLKECARNFEFLKNSEELANTFGSIGWAYRNQNKNDSAIYYLKKAGKEFTGIKNYAMVPVVTIEIGKALAENQKYNDALFYYKQAENEIVKYNLKHFGHGDALNNYISQSLIATNKYSEALPYTQKALKLAMESNDDEEMMDANYNMAIVNKNLGRFEQSVNQFEIYDSLRFKIEDAKQRQSVANIIEKHQSEKKEQQLKIKNAEISKKNLQLWGLIGLVSMLSLFSFLLYNRYRIKQEAKLQTAIFNQQTLATQAVLDGEERERKRIAADLHDGVGQTIMALKMNLLGINDHIEFKSPKAQQLFEKAVDLATESAKEVRSISHQMMPNALIKSGLASAIREFLQNIELQNLKINLEVNHLNEPLDPTTEKVLYRVIQELVNNVIKHAKANVLNISIDKNDKEILAKIEDNGKGFDSQSLDYEGIGLKNIQDRIAFLKGKIIIESSKNMGTKVLISIPLS